MFNKIKKNYILLVGLIFSSSVYAVGPIENLNMYLIDAEKDALVREVPFVKHLHQNAVTPAEFKCLPEYIDKYYLDNGIFVKTMIGYDENIPNQAWVTFDGGYLDNASQTLSMSEACKKIADNFSFDIGDGPQTTAVSATINSIKFINNSFITDEELNNQTVVKNSIGKNADVETLNNLVKTTSNYIKQQGFIIPQVKIVDTELGNISVSILEGAINSIDTENNSDLSDEAILNYVRHNLCDNENQDCKGAPIQSNNFERTVGILSDTPGTAGVSSTMSPGNELGTSNVNFSIDKAKPITGYISADNYGSRHTGKVRGTVGVLGNNLAGIGDQLIAELTATEESGNAIGQLGYSVPIGYDGWRVGALLSRTNSVLGEDFESLNYKIVSDALSLWASYPLIRSQKNNLTVRSSINSGRSETKIGGGTPTKSTSSSANIALNGRIIDDFIGRSYTSYGLRANLHRIKDSDTSQTNNYTTINYNLSRDQHLYNITDNTKLSLFLSGRGQQPSGKNHNTLTNCIGGPGGVRAYVGSEGCRQKTSIGTVELRLNTYLEPLIPGFLTYGIFYDTGKAQNAERDSDGSLNKRKLSGKGVSLNLSVLDKFAFRAEYAEREGEYPLPKADDTRKGKELWLYTSYNF